MKRCARNLGRYAWSALIVLAAWACSTATSQLQRAESLVLDTFTTRGKHGDDGMAWQLKGRRAVVRGALADLDDIVLTFHPAAGDEVRITSPKCVFNQGTGTGESDAPVKVVSRRFRLLGVGYNFAVDKHQVWIHDDVKMRIRQARGAGAAGPWPTPGMAGDAVRQGAR